MQEAEQILVAYYYFDIKDASKRDLRGLLASLLFQLSHGSDRCWDVLYQLYTAYRDGPKQPSDTVLAECLKSMLELPGQLPIFVIVDALDECPSNHGSPPARQHVLDFVERLVGSRYSNLFICIFSRPEQDISAVLGPLTSPSRCVSLHEEVQQTEDINGYIRTFVHTNPNMRRWRMKDKELVIDILSSRAGGK